MPALRTGQLTGDTTELLQQLIRNACVNDGTPDSGDERRNADLLQTYLEGAGIEVQRFTSRADRTSIVARIEGTDPTAPKVCLMGHTDVVPVSPSGWHNDPFGGELLTNAEGQQEVWGRGAVDMLNITSSMAVAVREIATSGFRPRGDLIYFGVADEEAGGVWGAKWMLDHHWDALACDYVLTEMGGWSVHGAAGQRVGISVGEKGIAWRRLRVTGTPGHGSMPFGADNALVTAAEIVRRLAAYRPKANIDEVYRAQIDASRYDDATKAALLDPARVWETLETLPVHESRRLHACAHTTFSPNVLHGGAKTNVIPDVVDIDVDIRTVPGTTGDDVNAHLREALGDALFSRVQVSAIFDDVSSTSPMGNPMWDAMTRQLHAVYPQAEWLPELIVGATDARFFRDKGVVAYGTGLFSRDVTMADFAARFHGHDERVDVESLGLCTDYWLGIVSDLLG